MLDIFPERMKIARQKSQMIQKEVAKKCNVSPAAYSFYESGQREPPYDFLVKFAQICNVSTDFLLGLSDDPEPRGVIPFTNTRVIRNPYADLSPDHRAALDAMASIFRQQEASSSIHQKEV